MEFRLRPRIGALPLIVLFCGSALFAEDTKKPTPYSLLYKEWKSEKQSIDDSKPAFTSKERRVKQRELNKRYTGRFLKLAQEHRDDRLWVDCLIWTTVEGVPGKDYDAMFDLMRDNAASLNEGDSHQLMLLMSELIPLSSERLNPALQKIAKSHPSIKLRGTALYALAARTKREAEFAGDAAGCKKAERLLESAIADFPDAATYRGKNHENAESLLKELRSPIAITRPALEISGRTIDGKDFKLREHKNRVVVLAFSGHWCRPCVAMHPIMKELVNKYSAARLTVVEINSDKEKDLDGVRKKIDADALKWLAIPEGSDGPISKKWQVKAWPTYYVLDQNHRIRHRGTGNLGEKLIDWVDELMKPVE